MTTDSIQGAWASGPADTPKFQDVHKPTSPASTPASQPAPSTPKTEPFLRRAIPPGETDSERVVEIRKARNPLLAAARVLLRALADMPESMDPDYALALRDLLVEEVKTFERLCTQSSIRRDHMIGARYSLCTGLDEVAMRVLGDGKDANVWAASTLATTFHEDTSGGVKVYLMIGRLLQETDEHIDLLEVIYRVLSLGFVGRYGHETNGHRKHEAVRQRLYNEIMSRREPVPLELSPNWQSDVKGKRATFYDFPVWITVVVLSVILLGMYGYDKYRLMTRAAEVQKQIADIAHMTPPPAPPVLVADNPSTR